MIGQNNVVRLLGLLVVVSLIIGWVAVAPVSGIGLTPPAQETPSAEEPPPVPETLPEIPEEPGEEPAAPEGGLGRIGTLVKWGIVGVVGVAFLVVVVVLLARPGKSAEEAPAQVPSVPITTLAADIKEGRVSKIVVSGEDLTITRIDGLMLVSHKEPTADLVQLLTNLGVTPEMMSTIIIEVETPGTPTG